MSHLSQVIAIEKDVKEKAVQALSQVQGVFGNTALLSGFARTYTPKDEEGEQLPPESTRVRIKAREELVRVQGRLIDLFDVIATKDWTNCVARADILVDGALLLKEVPATYLLFLEKQLAELAAFAKRIPTVDAAESWVYDSAQDCYAATPPETLKTKKIFRNHEKAPATKEWQAQVEVYTEDVTIGRWRTTKYSGALFVSDVNAILTRIEKLQRAVKFAREEANRTEVKQQDVGAALLKYIFG